MNKYNALNIRDNAKTFPKVPYYEIEKKTAQKGRLYCVYRSERYSKDIDYTLMNIQL